MKLKIIKYGEFTEPVRSHYNDSGIDVFSPIDYEIPSFGLANISLNFGIKIPDGYEIQVRPRSSMSKKGLLIQFGTVDAGYRGSISVAILNLNKDSYKILKGDKIAQLVLAPVVYSELVDDLGIERENNGFGSTGR